MAQYQYRHTLDIDDDDAFSDESKAILNAAFAVASHAHAGKSRKKIDPQWKYICHPIMAFDILRKLGETDPVVLAAAILHDSIEDNSEYKADPQRMCRALIRAFEEYGVHDDRDVTERHDGVAHAIADRIHQLCMEVTNPEVFGGEGIKENYQLDRVAGMSFDAKKVKIADQAASLICNLTMANDPAKFTPEQEINFTEKAHTLVTCIYESVQTNPKQKKILAPYASIFGHTLLHSIPLLQAPTEEAKEAIRSKFDFDRIFTATQDVDILPARRSEAQERLPLQDGDTLGLTWVDFDSNGNVQGYALWVDEGKESEANKIQQKMTDSVRAARRLARQFGDGHDLLRAVLMPRNLAPVAAADGKTITGWERVFELTPPLNPTAFASCAKAAGAVSRTQQNGIISKGDAIKQLIANMIELGQRRRPETHPRINPFKGKVRFYD